MQRQLTKLVDVYNSNGVYMGQKMEFISQPETSAIFDYDEYEQQSAYGYDHSAYAPDIGDK